MQRYNDLKTLILKSDRNEFERYYIEHMQGSDVLTTSFYRFSKHLLWKIQWLHMKILNLPFQEIFYGNWKKNIEKFDRIIVFDENLNWNIISYLRRKNPKARIIVWYWNPINEHNLLSEKYRDMCEVWSFDKNDCQRYGFKNNIQFTVIDYERGTDENINDLIFIGADKGRAETVIRLKKIIESIGMSFFVRFPSKYGKDGKFQEYKSKMIEYSTIIEYEKKSRCIVEILQEGQSGMSLRAIEAIALGKKLITNNLDLPKMNFFDDTRIFVLDVDNMCDSVDDIKQFLELKFNDYSKEVYNTYSFESWLKNFNGEGEP